MLSLEGVVEDIIFRNEVNSYTVAVLNTPPDGDATIVGYAPFINIGETITVEGGLGVSSKLWGGAIGVFQYIHSSSLYHKWYRKVLILWNDSIYRA